MELQIVLIFILAIITVVLVAVGVYVVLVLREVRATVIKANLILESVENVTNAVAHPMSLITGVIEGFKTFKNLRRED